MNVPVAGSSDAGPFTGTLDVQRFEALDGHHVLAVGVLRGMAGSTTIKDQAVALPVAVVSDDDDHRGDHRGGEDGRRGALLRDGPTRRAAAHAWTGQNIVLAQVVCPILGLRLQPTDLNLLGLVVHLDTVAIAVAAEQGQLLGNLLCAIAGLLDNPPALAAALNQVANALAGVGL
ncbi:MAG TPA: hypothetical protein VFP65_12635 [Anaeromyxobacteraceae bacterium]|nr:hypothetical protein [Anaeromyxobacteraceae bacterium]